MQQPGLQEEPHSGALVGAVDAPQLDPVQAGGVALPGAEERVQVHRRGRHVVVDVHAHLVAGCHLVAGQLVPHDGPGGLKLDGLDKVVAAGAGDDLAVEKVEGAVRPLRLGRGRRVVDERGGQDLGRGEDGATLVGVAEVAKLVAGALLNSMR